MFGDKTRTRHGSQGVETLIGPGAVLQGDIRFSGGLYVEGRIVGTVCAEDGQPAVLTLGAQGSIEGEVRVPVAVICGELVGNVYSSERVELAASARVRGDVHYRLVEMAAGAMITGRLIHADTAPAALAAPVADAAEARALSLDSREYAHT